MVWLDPWLAHSRVCYCSNVFMLQHFTFARAAVACRDRVQPLLRSLCCGVGEPELVAAVSGLLAGSAAVRASALSALPHVPTLAEGLPPESGEVLAVMALARHDADEDNAAAAEALWTQVGVTLIVG